MLRFRISDIDDYAALNADPEVTRFLGGPWDRGRAWRHLAFLIGHWRLGRPGMWALEEKETGAFLGAVGFSEPEGWPGFELAGVLGRRFWGRGYARGRDTDSEDRRRLFHLPSPPPSRIPPVPGLAETRRPEPSAGSLRVAARSEP